MKKLAISLFLAATCLFSDAATITLNKGLSPGFMLQTSAGANLSGGVVAIGTFANGLAPATPADGIYTSILSSFREFGTAAAPAAGSPITGSVTVVPASPADFNTLQMYMIVGNGATLAASTEIAIVTNTPATSFPANTTAAGSTNFNVNTFSNLAVVAGAGALTDNASGPESLKMVPIVPVPEPTVFGLLGACLAFGIRRRR